MKPVTLPGAEVDREYNLYLDSIFLNAEVFVSTNVTEYYYAGTDQEFWHFDKHFPNLAPVFDSFWIETKAPTHIKSAVHGMQGWNDEASEYYQRPPRWGAWFINSSSESVRAHYKESDEVFKKYGITLDSVWLYTITMFMEPEGEPVQPMWTFAMLINRDTGQALKNPVPLPACDPHIFMSEPMGRIKQKIQELIATYGNRVLSLPGDNGKIVNVTVRNLYEMEMIGLLKPLMLALSFMHCRNVARVPVVPAPKQNKKRMARNLPPFNKFYTLEIAPMQRIIQQAVDEYRGRKGYTGIEMALHRVIGHFKTYTPEKPLMGHAVGTWFWSGMTRGSKKRGTIHKDYEVKAPTHG